MNIRSHLYASIFAVIFYTRIPKCFVRNFKYTKPSNCLNHAGTKSSLILYNHYLIADKSSQVFDNRAKSLKDMKSLTHEHK